MISPENVNGMKFYFPDFFLFFIMVNKMNIKKRYSDNVNYNLNRENLTSILECSNVFNLSLSQSR